MVAAGVLAVFFYRVIRRKSDEATVISIGAQID
jgi:hypothetical protein